MQGCCDGCGNWNASEGPDASVFEDQGATASIHVSCLLAGTRLCAGRNSGPAGPHEQCGLPGRSGSLQIPLDVESSAARPQARFCKLHGLSEEIKTFPFSYWTEIVPYTFDCWPNVYDWWASFYKRERIRIAFISARQSAQYFAGAFPRMRVVWLPEAVDPGEYRASRPLAERDIDVLEMGRRHEIYHERIAEETGPGQPCASLRAGRREIHLPR